MSSAYVLANRTLESDEEAPLYFDLDNDAKLESVLVSLFARHHFGEGWAADVLVPMGMVTLAASNGESRRASGFGDIQVGGRYDFAGLWGGGGFSPSLTLRLGLGLPTGERATLGIGTSVAPTVLSVGLGAFAANGELRYTQFVHRSVAFAVPMSTRIPLHPIDSGTTIAPTTSAGLEIFTLPTDWLVLRAGAVYSHRAYDQNDVEGTLLNSGGEWLRARLNAAFQIKPVTLGLGGGAPLYVNVNGRQITETFSADAFVSVTLGASDDDEHDHEDEHHHGDDHDHGSETTGDVRDIAMGGESFVLADVVVPGRVTVIDFWAKWCHPCEHIDHALRELAADNPELTVLRAEAPDLDAAIVDAQLGGEIALPTVWIFDRRGALIRKMTGTNVEAVRAELSAALAAHP